jgi:hypothetical protein
MRKYIFLLTGVIFLFTSISFSQIANQKYLDDDSLHRSIEYQDEEISLSSTLTDSNLTVVGEWPWGQCYAVAVRDSYALIGNGKLIQVMDISDPSNPTVAAEYNTGGLVRDIQVRDSLAFVCTRGGLQILNISNLFSPQEISFLSLIAAKQVIPTDSFAYVLEDPGYNPLIKVIDINDSSNPFVRSSTPTVADFVVHMAVRNRTIYATGSNLPFLTIIDATNPDSPVHHDARLISRSICIRDTLMYLAVTSSLAIYSIADPFNPVFLAEKFCGVYSNLSGVEVGNGYAYALNDSGLFVFNVADPYNISVANNFRMPKGTIVNYDAGLLHISSLTGYDIVNVSNVDSIYREGKFYTGGTPNDIAIQGHYAYVATGRPGLTILDLTNPIVPVRVGVLDLGTTSYSIAVKDSFAYIGADGFWTVDISNPQLPMTTSFSPSVVFYKDFRTISDIVISDKKILTLDTTITIYDISNPSKPIEIIKYNVPKYSYFISIHDSLLFVVSEDSGSSVLIVLNVSDVLNISETYRSPFPARGICVKDTLAYVADDYGLTIINLSQPGFPVISSITTPGSRSIVDMIICGKYLYMSYGTVVIVDVSEPLSPKVVGRGGGSGRIEAYDKYLYLCGDIFLTIIRNELITSVSGSTFVPTENMLFQNYPNPFNGFTNINFSIKEFGLTTIKIFNIAGQEINTIFEKHTSPGNYTISWDTANLTSGVYFYQLRAKSYLENKKGVLIK